MRRQEEGESVDSFITSLYCLAEHCNYRELHNEMIRDWIVVGLRDAVLSERLQSNSELTLDKAITMARQTEAVKEQQPVVRGNVENIRTKVDTVQGVQSLQQYKPLGTLQKNILRHFPVNIMPKPVQRDVQGVANLRHIHVINVLHVKQNAANAGNRAIISQYVDPQLWQQFMQELSQKNLF